MMKRALFLLSFLLASSISHLALAQTTPVTQCVTTAVAGGTSDAITIPTLPCVPTTTLLELTITSNNATSAPTLQYPGGPAQVIRAFNGASLSPGSLLANGRYLLSNNGANWFVLQTGILQNLSNNCQNIAGYGAVSDGVTDNSTALAAAIAAQGSNPCVSFPPGKFAFTSTAVISLTAPYGTLSLIGSGPGVTELIGSTGIIALTLNSQFSTFNFQDFSVESSSACIGCEGISVIQAASTTSEGYTPASYFTRVHFYGTDRNINQGGATNGVKYWGTGIYLQGVSNVNFEGVFIQGLANNISTAAQIGIDIETTNSNTPVVFNMHSSAINSTKTAVELNDKVQGVTVSQSNFTNDGTCINVPAGAGTGSQLTVTSSQFSCNTAIDVNAPWGGVQIANNQFIIGEVGSANFYGVILAATAQYAAITGNVFSGNGTSNTFGIAASTVTNAGIITGNQFGSLNFGTVLNPGAVGWVINPNEYTNNTFSVVNNASFGNVINNSVYGGEPTVGSGGSDCGTGAAFSSGATDSGGVLEVGTSPGTKCTITFNHAFISNPPNCSASNTSSLTRGVAALFVTTTGMQLSSSGSLNAGDFLQYRCDGYQ